MGAPPTSDAEPLLPASARSRSRRPAQGIRNIGEIAVLCGQVLVALVTPPFVWRREFLRQCIFVLRVSSIPLAIAVPIYAFGAPGVQGGGFMTELGAVDRLGGFIVIGVVRDFGIFVVASYMAGIYGTTITAELGARKIRDELEALEVMGVDTLHYMVVPRVLALVAMLALFASFIGVVGTFGGWVAATILYDSTNAAFFNTYFLNSSWIDVVQSYGKAVVIGFLVGVVCCYKGLKVEGGAGGVGRAVNEAIVASLVIIFFVNLVYTMLFLSMFPESQILR